MTDRAALLAAVLAAPEDDAPRLVYADWLDDHSEPERAEFIRVQVELAHAKVHPNGHTDEVDGRWVINDARDCSRDDCRACALRRRERALLSERWGSWIRSAGTVPNGWRFSRDGEEFHVWRDTPFDDGFRLSFARGFVAAVKCTFAAWLAHGDALAAVHPVTAVRLTTWPDHRWQMSNLPPDWPLSGRHPGERLVALDALEHRWPGVREWVLPAAG